MCSRRSDVRFVLAMMAALGLMACGGGSSPFQATSSAGAGSVSVSGTVLGSTGAAATSLRSLAAAETITVTVVEKPAITAVVAADGSFTLRGLPEGGFTLRFTGAGGVLLGELSFAEVRANQEITITVSVDGGAVTLLEEQRNGIGHGDLEIQGSIDELISVDSSADSVLLIDGYRVVVRPGQTAIRQGGRSIGVEDLGAGDQVHVKGVYMDLEAGQNPADQAVLAHEIKLQREAAEGTDTDDEETSTGGADKITVCHKEKTTITIGSDAWPAHQAHGDTMGACTGN